MPHIIEWKLRLFQNFVAVHVGDGDLSSRQQVQVRVRVVVYVVAELGELRRAVHHVFLYQIGHIDFVKALRPRHIQHQINQRPLQTRAHPLQNVAARPGQLDAAFKIDHVQRRAKLPVRFRLEIELEEVAFRFPGRIIFFAVEHRHAAVRQVRQPQHIVVKLCLHLGDTLIKTVDLISQTTQSIRQLVECGCRIDTRRECICRRFAIHQRASPVIITGFQRRRDCIGPPRALLFGHFLVTAQPPHTLVQPVALRLNRFGSRQQTAPFFIQFQNRVDPVQRGRIVQLGNLFAYPIRFFTDQGNI